MLTNPLRILLVDDDKDNCFFFNEAISQLNINIDLLMVHDGEELMWQLNNSNKELPEIIFLDLNMPCKNGVECLTEIRQNIKLNKLPVVILSTTLNQSIINKLFDIGAQYYIRKPIDLILLIKALNQAIKYILDDKISVTTREKFVIYGENKLL